MSIYRCEFDYYHKRLAKSTDQWGNCLCQYLFNRVLIKKAGYKFGNIDETISSVIGKNKMSNTLTPVGKFVDYCLTLAEPNHSIKSIDNTVNDK